VQQGFLPHSVPQLPRFQFAAHYDPAFHVGGDFYDFIDLGDGRLGVVLADVSGHGVSAALFMARLSSHIRSIATIEKEPYRVFSRTQALLEDNQDGMFATILYLVLDPVTGTVLVSNAGHMPPIHRRPREGNVRSMNEISDIMLGVMPTEAIRVHTFALTPGDTLFLYSDGLVEARNEEGLMYGVDRLVWVCGQGDASAPAMLNQVLRDFDGFIGRQEHGDDVTIVSLTFTG